MKINGNLFDIVGMFSSLMFLLCISGLVVQIKKIMGKMSNKEKEVTKILSLNQFTSSYLSFFGFFIFSFLITDTNYYLFWTRFFACFLTLVIIFLIAIDRKNVSSNLVSFTVILSLILAMILFKCRLQVMDYAKNGAIIMIVVSTVLLAQGGLHQITKIRKERSTGALSLSMSIFFFLKDLSNIAFGIVMGIYNGWPLILMGIVSASMKGAVLYSFHWANKVKGYQ